MNDLTNEQPVIAAIIDTRTGEISETTTITKEKNRLRLKVRDELNSVHGRDTFLLLDFSPVSRNVNWVKSLMKTEDPEAFNEAIRLNIKYMIWDKKQNIARIEGELAKVVETQDECLALYDSSSKDKHEIVADLFIREIEDFEETLREQNRSLQFMVRQLNKF